jgi:hypothetical protein
VNPIRDKSAYREVLKTFMRRRSSADEFLSRFDQLRQGDRHKGITGSVMTGTLTHEQSALRDVLASIQIVCEAYSRSLPPGCGYRASEDQFRAELRAIARTSPYLELEESPDDKP